MSDPSPSISGLGAIWVENKASLLRGAECDLLRYGNPRYCDEFSQSVNRKWVDGGTEEQALEALLGAHQTAPKSKFRTHLLPRTTTFLGANPAWIAERDSPRIVLHPVPHPVLLGRGLSTCKPRNNRWNTDKNCTRQKPFHGRERPHFFRLFAGQIPSGASGGHSRSWSARSARSFGVLPRTSFENPDQTASRVSGRLRRLAARKPAVPSRNS